MRIPDKADCAKKKESAEDHKATKVPEVTPKHTAKINKSKMSLQETVNGTARNQVIISKGFTVIDCKHWAVSFGIPMLIPTHDAKENVIAVSQLPENLTLPPISADIL